MRSPCQCAVAVSQSMARPSASFWMMMVSGEEVACRLGGLMANPCGLVKASEVRARCRGARPASCVRSQPAEPGVGAVTFSAAPPAARLGLVGPRRREHFASALPAGRVRGARPRPLRAHRYRGPGRRRRPERRDGLAGLSALPRRTRLSSPDTVQVDLEGRS